jgi:hypothetical protein
MRESRFSRWVGWLAVAGVLIAFQGYAFFVSLRHTFNENRVNNDSLQQIFPFYRYLGPSAFDGDYIADYYLACYPLGYRALYAITASIGIDPAFLSRCLPHVLFLVTALCMGATAYRFGGKLAAFAVMALVLGSNAYLSRIGGGLPRGFGFPIISATLLSLAAGRPGWCALCVVFGALFYPVTAVISGLCLAGMLLAPKVMGLEAPALGLARRITLLSGTALLAGLLLLPTALSSSRFGGVVRADETREFPEAGPGGRYTQESRPPFLDFFHASADDVRRAVVSTSPNFAGVRAWLAENKEVRSSRRFERAKDGVLLLVLLGGFGLLLRRPAARRVLVLLAASWFGHAVARQVAPYAYLPERYSAYSLPLLTTLAVSVAVAGFFPSAFDRGSRRTLRAGIMAIYVTTLLVFVSGRITANIGVDVAISKDERRLLDFVSQLPPTVVVAGWPTGPVNEIPYVSRRRVLLNKEVHQAFHKGYIEEMRRRMRGLIDAYLATSVDPIVRLRDELGVTHLVVQRSHFEARLPNYFRPFDRRIGQRIDAAQGKAYELPKQYRAAKVFANRDCVLLDLSLVRPD